MFASNFIGSGPASSAVSVVAATVPLQPQAPIKVSADETTVTIRWYALRQDNGSATDFNGGSPVTKFRVYYDDSGSFALLSETTDLVTLQYTLTGATTGKTYGFKVSAVNVVGEGPLSPASFIIAAKVPDKPVSLAKVSASITQITISFTAPYTGGTPLTGYKFYWNNGSGTTFTLLQSVTDLTTQYSTSPQVASLTAGALYRFKISAVNAIGESLQSDEIAIYAATVPGAPAAPTMVSQSDTGISIQWAALPVGSNGGSAVTDYKVYWDNGEGLGVFYLKQATTTPALSFTASSVVAGKTYSFKISAVNIVGEGNMSPSVQIIAATLPGTPSTPTIVSADSSPQITIQWNAPGYDGGSAVTNYRVYMDGVFVGSTINSVRTYTQSTGMTVGNTYAFKVSAVNVVGEGTISGSVSAIAA